MLTKREVGIIRHLIEAKTPITIKSLADSLGASERTIKYDLPHVRDFLEKNDMSLTSRPGLGLTLNTHDIDKKRIYELLAEAGTTETRDVRIVAMTKQLLLAESYLTASQLSEALKVSRNTTLKDLNEVEQFIKPWQLTLLRMPRMGYLLEGQELQKRMLIENLIHRDLTHQDTYQLLTFLAGDVGELHFEMAAGFQPILKQVIPHLKAIYEERQDAHFLLSLLFRLIISVYRLSRECTAGGYQLLDENTLDRVDENQVLRVAKKVYEGFNLPIFEAEFYYVLKGSLHNTNQIDLVSLTEKLIAGVSEDMGLSFRRDAALYSNLLAHLTARFQNEGFSLTEYNPLLSEIKEMNPRLFGSIERVFEGQMGRVGDADSFISFLALHFLVAYENLMNRKKIRVLYVCSTGKGVARLVKNRIESRISGLEMVTYCNVGEVEDVLAKEEIDLIISVFPFTTTVPIIVVDGIPTDRDIEKIKEKVRELLGDKKEFARQYEDIPTGLEKPDTHSPKDLSLEIILKGFEVSTELISRFDGKLQEDKVNALRMHLFLMIHRYLFDEQYDNESVFKHTDALKVSQFADCIKDCLHAYDLHVNESEVYALLAYFK